jgi:hypothetical protein
MIWKHGPLPDSIKDYIRSAINGGKTFVVLLFPGTPEPDHQWMNENLEKTQVWREHDMSSGGHNEMMVNYSIITTPAGRLWCFPLLSQKQQFAWRACGANPEKCDLNPITETL